MKTVRLALSLALCLVIVGGYFAGQLAGINGNLPNYYEKLDQPNIHLFELVLLIAALGVGLVPERKEPTP